MADLHLENETADSEDAPLTGASASTSRPNADASIEEHNAMVGEQIQEEDS